MTYICLVISVIICPISYIVEKTLGPKEVTQMAKKQQSTQQTSRKVEKGTWDTPSRPITPTPATAPPNTPGQPAQQPAPAQQPTQPAQQPAQPTTDPQSTTQKE